MFHNSFSKSLRLNHALEAIAGIALSIGVVGCVSAADQPTTTAQPKQIAQANPTHTTSRFQGVKANTGYATHTTIDGKQILSVSDDFQIPNTPAPHWQVVDSAGNV